MLHRIQILRGLSALAVVLSHYQHWINMATGRAQNENILAFGTFAVYIFFLISGFIIYYSHKRELGDRRNLSKYLIKRAFRIYPVYWLFSAVNVMLLAHATATWDAVDCGGTPREILSAIFLLPLSLAAKCSGFLGVAWSLFYEIIFYAIFAICFFSRATGFIVLTCYTLMCGIGSRFGLDIYWLNRCGVLFATGCVIAILHHRIRLHYVVSRTIIILGGVAWVGAVWMFQHGPELAKAMAIAAAVMLVAGAVKLDIDMPLGSDGIFMGAMIGLGSISYSLYLCHTIAGAIIFPLLGGPQTSFPVSLAYLLVPIILATVSYFLVERPCQRLSRRLCKSERRILNASALWGRSTQPHATDTHK